MPDESLTAAYSISGPEDCLRVYGKWAETYDSGFALDMDYQLPAHVASAFLAAGGEGPVLQAGVEAIAFGIPACPCPGYTSTLRHP